MRNFKDQSSLQIPEIACSYFDEASLEFAGEREHVSPQLGITLFGPRSLDISQRHPSSIKVGFVGSGRSIESAKSWFTSCMPGVRGDENNMDFPGFQDDRGFFSKLTMDDNWVETITQHEISSIGKPHFRKERFKLALDVVSDKVRLLSQKDRPPDYIVLAFPDEMLQHCKTAQDYSPELGGYHIDFRRSIKAEVMKYHLPTQIFDELVKSSGSHFQLDWVVIGIRDQKIDDRGSQSANLLFDTRT